MIMTFLIISVLTRIQIIITIFEFQCYKEGSVIAKIKVVDIAKAKKYTR